MAKRKRSAPIWERLGYKTEYRYRREYRSKLLGVSPQQATGKPRKGELPLREQERFLGDPKHSVILRRMYSQLDGEARAEATELYKKASREKFRKRTSKNEPPTAFDMLLLMLSDLDEQAEFGIKVSDPTAELIGQLRAGMFSDLPTLSATIRDELGL